MIKLILTTFALQLLACQELQANGGVAIGVEQNLDTTTTSIPATTNTEDLKTSTQTDKLDIGDNNLNSVQPVNKSEPSSEVTTTTGQPIGNVNNPVAVTEGISTIIISESPIQESTLNGDANGKDEKLDNESSPTNTGGEHQPTQKPSAIDIAKEAELEAVQAVDASIAFGENQNSLADTCYDEYGNARYCEPEFENVAFERLVQTSSECGQPPSRFCAAHPIELNGLLRNCHICDAQHPKRRHPAAYLTDLNDSNSPTCWVSEPIRWRQSNSTDEQPLDERVDNVTLTLNLDKKYEITYISLQFCSPRPDSLAIYKSVDFGQSWSPYQFYSSDCRDYYGRPAKSVGQSSVVTDRVEPTCLDASSTSSASTRVAFSTLDGRGGQLEKSVPLQEWITATNIRVVLDRQTASWMRNNQLAIHIPSSVAMKNATDDSELDNSLTSPTDTHNYAMSDLTVGGRCKCNGHASRCVQGPDGKLQCDCRHNTAGRDCERCAPFHFDRPWARATQLDANPCQPCNCNGHSRKCRFDADLYKLSGRRSGGVCIACRHNTSGRHCHYCMEGYTRDHSKPISDKEACKQCNCHPLGSLGKVCNQTSGQCPCKEGVTGLECNRCAHGYQQSNSPSEPCIKLPENDINYEPAVIVDTEDQPSDPASSEHNTQIPQEGELNEVVDVPSVSRSQSNSRPHRLPKVRPELMDAGHFNDPLDKLDDDIDREDYLSQRARHRQLSQWAPKRRPTDWRYHWRQFNPSIGDQQQDDDSEANENFLGYPSRRYNPKLDPSIENRGFTHLSRENLDPDMSNLDPGDDDANSMNNLRGYVNPNYNDDSFNQILHNGGLTHTRRPIQSTRGKYPLAESNRRLYKQMGMKVPVLAADSECGNCQLKTRRSGFRQFCNLDYAIKATVLKRISAEDWTKFEVEIQDIFKSPISSHDSNSRGLQASSGNSHNMGAIDDLDSSESESKEPQTKSASLSDDNSRVQQNNPKIRFKVGSVQWIWVPTEDFACKCPKLKQKSTYLIMGTVDGHEASANSIQLDRHGVALEWKSSTQVKMNKYQRRYANGEC